MVQNSYKSSPGSRGGSANGTMVLLSDHLADCCSEGLWQAAAALTFLCCSEEGDFRSLSLKNHIHGVQDTIWRHLWLECTLPLRAWQSSPPCKQVQSVFADAEQRSKQYLDFLLICLDSCKTFIKGIICSVSLWGLQSEVLWSGIRSIKNTKECKYVPFLSFKQRRRMSRNVTKAGFVKKCVRTGWRCGR